MKKIFISVLLALVSLSIKAQTSKGMMNVGGDVSYQNTSYSGGGKSNTFSFSPSFGYFLSDNLALGLALGYTNTSTTGSPSNNTFSIAPFVRYYKFTSENKFAFFGQGSVGYANGTGQNGTVSVSVRPGFAYFFTPHWGLDLLLPGLQLASGNNTTTFDISASLAPTLGLRYYFGK
jgi:hypothetical protein